MRTILFVCTFLYCALAASKEAVQQLHPPLNHPLYIGFDAGYGSTTWKGLVPSPENLNYAMRTSTPLVASEGGTIWGFVAGYEFSPFFAIEANYTRYPQATVLFDEESIYAFENDGAIDLHTDTDTISIMAKIMVKIPRTRLRGYSSFGIAQIHRWDDLADTKRGSPTFGLGFIYDISDHIMTELGANYTAGYGASEINPAMDYVPFLYSGFLRLAYRI